MIERYTLPKYFDPQVTLQYTDQIFARFGL